ncbi:hypothetical protein KFL_001640190 [Klebsormidium nitens]|uniref:Uncharacterized protein n=1 Tax=Klebsormidium nitens TaxID=105231 RepID=A0A0U9HK10_KLENI|nr:hypothetical protein KFL_001640190 [Klebsormidium nitens]|eukprot:GAQ83844.1 hypothetical protein KFL_001640190 [Klebsormidium nitens]
MAGSDGSVSFSSKEPRLYVESDGELELLPLSLGTLELVRWLCLQLLRVLLRKGTSWQFDFRSIDGEAEVGKEELLQQGMSQTLYSFLNDFDSIVTVVCTVIAVQTAATPPPKSGCLEDAASGFGTYNFAWAPEQANEVARLVLRLFKMWSLPSDLAPILSEHEVGESINQSPGANEKQLLQGIISELRSFNGRDPLLFDGQTPPPESVSTLAAVASLASCHSVFKVEWVISGKHTNLGRGDLVLTNRFGIFLVVEVKYLVLSATGKVARARRRNHRRDVKKQAIAYRDHLQSHLSDV